MKKLLRMNIEELSLKAFGSKTKYKKLMEKGKLTDLKDETGRVYKGYQKFDLEEIQQIMVEEIEDQGKKLAEKEAKNVGTNPELSNTNT